MIKHKFNAKITERDGIKFHSRKEAYYYDELKSKVEAGLVLFFHRQVPIDLPGGVKYRVDFLEFHSDGTVHYVDVKGYKTPEYKAKKKMVEAIYPITIEEK
jgi:hypothetical protein